jgi:predicted metal-dependent hydrolase
MTIPASDREAPAAVDVTIDGRTVPLTLRRSARARRYTLRLAPTGDLVLTIPARGSMERGLAFAKAHQGWIRARLGRLPERVAFADGAVIPFRGTPHEIRHAGSRRGLVEVAAAPDGDAMPLICVAGDPAHLPRRLADWLKRQARGDLEAAAGRHAGAAGVTVRRLSVRDQTSRWGSCSASGALSFSWRLILAPGFVLDYLAAHEVAHLVEMNHGPRFWRLTRRLAPQTDEAEAWLKRHGPGLHRYGPR